MPDHFKVGDKAVCIRSQRGRAKCFPDHDLPVVGKIYTVVWIGSVSEPRYSTTDVILDFAELHSPGGYCKCGLIKAARGYLSQLFRPLRKTGMEMLRDVLANPGRPIRGKDPKVPKRKKTRRMEPV